MALTRKTVVDWLLDTHYPQDIVILHTIEMDKHDHDRLTMHFEDHHG